MNTRRSFLKDVCMAISISLLPEILRPSKGDLVNEYGEPIPKIQISFYNYPPIPSRNMTLFDGRNHSAYWLPKSFEK